MSTKTKRTYNLSPEAVDHVRSLADAFERLQEIIDEGVLRSVCDAGWDNYVYGAVTADEHQRCRALMLTGLITDYPALGRK